MQLLEEHEEHCYMFQPCSWFHDPCGHAKRIFRVTSIAELVHDADTNLVGNPINQQLVFGFATSKHKYA